MLIRQNPMIKSSDIEKMLGLSRKQLNYSMRKINAWLQWEHLPVIQRTKQGGFILNEQASMKLFMQKAEPESAMSIRMRSACRSVSSFCWECRT